MRSSIELADRANAAYLAGRARRLDAVVSLMESDEWKGDGARDFASWLAAHWQLSGPNARQLVRDATALRARPALQEALFEGAVSEDQCKTWPCCVRKVPTTMPSGSNPFPSGRSRSS